MQRKVVANIEGSPNLSADDSFRSPGDLQRYLQPLLKCLFALGPLFAFGYTLPKLSLLLFYLRVFVGKISIAIYVFIAVVIVEMIAFLVSAILYCQPVAFYVCCSFPLTLPARVIDAFTVAENWFWALLRRGYILPRDVWIEMSTRPFSGRLAVATPVETPSTQASEDWPGSGVPD